MGVCPWNPRPQRYLQRNKRLQCECIKYYFYLCSLRVKLLQDKILQNVPEHTYIEGFEKNWGGRMPSSHSESDICASPRHLSQSLKMWLLSFPPPMTPGTYPQFAVTLSNHSSAIAQSSPILKVLIDCPSARALLATQRRLCKMVMPSESNWKGAHRQIQWRRAAIISTIKSHTLADQEIIDLKK